jgi:uncharacterized protein (DUF1684 family)
MRGIHTILLFCIVHLAMAQDKSYIKEIEAYRAAQHKEFSDPSSSPLTVKDLEKFEGLDYFPIDENYRVKARFEATPGEKSFPLGTSTGSTQLYRRLGILHFELEGKQQTLEAYLRVQGFSLSSKVDYVFLPVLDATSGKTTYAAGRYLHYEGIPEGEEWIIDFNKLYNPLCAYNERYECPLVPEANYLSIPINAGVKDYTSSKPKEP